MESTLLYGRKIPDSDGETPYLLISREQRIIKSLYFYRVDFGQLDFLDFL